MGLLNDGLSEKMKLDPNLTLEKAVSTAHQSEAVHKQQGVVRGTSHESDELKSENLEAVNSRQGNKTKSVTQKYKSPGKTAVNKQRIQVTNALDVAKHWRNRQQCRAKDAQCYNCQKTGHYSPYCYAK